MRLPAALRDADWAAVATWLLCFGIVAYLGLDGGGFDALVHDRIALAIWALLLAGVLVGALPRRRLGALPVAALGIFVAFAGWTALSLSWTESVERTIADLARVSCYLAILGFALSTRAPGESRRLIGALVTAMAIVAGVALLSRLIPDWFPEAGQTASFVSGGEGRLSYPINYWNGLGALLAMGLPLAVCCAASARGPLLRALTAAALPAFVLALFLTLSRAGIGAAMVATLVFLVLTPGRLAALTSTLLGAAGGAVLVLASLQRDAFRDGLGDSAAQQQGEQMLLIVLGVSLAVGLAQFAAIRLLERRPARPRFALSRPGGRATAALVLAAIALLGVGAVAADAPDRSADAWEEFKYGGRPDSGASRLGSVAGQNRYQYWSSAVRANATSPLLGIGSGTFEYWWGRDGDLGDTIRDAHSLYMQTLAELGIVGLLLLIGFLVLIPVAAARALRSARGSVEQPAVAAALSGCLAFCLTATFDWVWQVPVLSAVLMMLAALLLWEASVERGTAVGGLPWKARIAAAVAAVAAIVATAIPYTSTQLLRDSSTAARDGDLPAAYADARDAEAVLPEAASPYLQQALVLEELGDLAGATRAARDAVERESTNWRTWLVLSRLEARRGRAPQAVEAFRRARELNTHSQLLEP